MYTLCNAHFSILVMVVAVVMVCSLSSFPLPQPQCSPYKNSPRVCAYEEHRTACAVQCVCTRERLCVCNGGGGEPPRPLLHLSPKLHLPPLHHQVVGVGAAQDLLQDQTRAKQGHKKKWLFLQRFLPKVDLASVVSFLVVLCCLSICSVTRTIYNQHLIIDTSLTCVGSGARWGGVCYSILVEEHW